MKCGRCFIGFMFEGGRCRASSFARAAARATAHFLDDMGELVDEYGNACASRTRHIIGKENVARRRKRQRYLLRITAREKKYLHPRQVFLKPFSQSMQEVVIQGDLQAGFQSALRANPLRGDCGTNCSWVPRKSCPDSLA